MSTNTWIPDERWWPEGLKTYEYDPDRAKQLLEEVKWDSNRELLFLSYYNIENEFAYYVDAWAQVGIKVRFRYVDGATWQQEYNVDKNWDLGFAAAACADPDAVYSGLHCDMTYPRGGNAEEWCNPRFSELMDKGRSIPDFAARKPIYDEAMLIFNEELPWLPLYEPNYFYIIQKQLYGLEEWWCMNTDTNYFGVEKWWMGG